MTAFASDATHRTAMVNGNVFEITCPVCPPAAEDAPVQNGFSTEFAVKAVLERFDGVPEANASKFIDAVVTAKMHDVIANNDATVNALVRQQRYDKRRETVLRTVQSICDAAYCPNFPHCKCEIANFDGSRMALQCAGDNSCTANFCGCRRIHKPPSVRECAVLAAMAISAPVGKWAVVMMAIDFGIASGTPNDDDNDASGDGDAQT
eukprot:gene1666-2313_t